MDLINRNYSTGNCNHYSYLNLVTSETSIYLILVTRSVSASIFTSWTNRNPSCLTY